MKILAEGGIDRNGNGVIGETFEPMLLCFVQVLGLIHIPDQETIHALTHVENHSYSEDHTAVMLGKARNFGVVGQLVETFIDLRAAVDEFPLQGFQFI